MTERIDRREFLRQMTGVGVGIITASTMGFSTKSYKSTPVHPDRYGIQILVDGWRSDQFQDMLEKGELPNIQKHLVDRGVMIENCATVLPSTTGPAHMPVLTGTMPGHNHITGIRFVDRKARVCRDYCNYESLEAFLINSDYEKTNKLKIVQTLYEVVHPYPSLAIFELVSKGAKLIKLPIKGLWGFAKGDWAGIDRIAAEGFERAYLHKDGTTRENLPRFTAVMMPAVDHISHFHGPLSEETREQARNVDKYIGQIVKVLKKCKIYDKTLISLDSDHGQRDTSHNRDLNQYLKELGLNVKITLGPGGKWHDIERYNVVSAVSGNGFAHVYLSDRRMIVDEAGLQIFKGGWDWRQPPTYESLRHFPLDNKKHIDTIESLLQFEAIKLLFVKPLENRYFVFSSNGGQSEILRQGTKGTKYKYQVLKQPDPLGYSSDEKTASLVDGEFHTGDEWLAASCTAKYVDALVQISQIFDSERCGDIVVSSAPGYDLMPQGHVGTHGGLERGEMVVPGVLAGPEINQKRLKYARTVDFFPTFLKFFELDDQPADIDGQTLDIF